MRPIDPRYANRRSPTVFGEETGYDIPNSVPDGRPAKLPHQPMRPPAQIQPGVRVWRHPSGHVMDRCDAHAPMGAEKIANTSTARCPTCIINSAPAEIEPA